MKTYIEECSILRGFIDYEERKSPFFYDCEKVFYTLFQIQRKN